MGSWLPLMLVVVVTLFFLGCGAVPVPPTMPEQLYTEATITNREEGTLVERRTYFNFTTGQFRREKYNSYGNDTIIRSPDDCFLQLFTHTAGKPSCYEDFISYRHPGKGSLRYPNYPYLRTEVIDGVTFNVFKNSYLSGRYHLYYIFMFSRDTFTSPVTGGQERKYKIFNWHLTVEGSFAEVLKPFPAYIFYREINVAKCTIDFNGATLPPTMENAYTSERRNIQSPSFEYNNMLQGEDETTDPSWLLGVPQFGQEETHLSNIEGILRSAKSLPHYDHTTTSSEGTSIDGGGAAVDNRKYGTAIRNQGASGACWAFASAAAIEIVYNKKHNIIVEAGSAMPYNAEVWPLSPQYLIDCVGGDDHGHYPYHTKGVNGGYPGAAMMYVKMNGIPSEREYSFRGVTGRRCDAAVVNKSFPVSEVRQLVSWPRYARDSAENVHAMMHAIEKHGAVVVMISVPGTWWHYDGRGVYGANPTVSCYPGFAHVVVLVGYGLDAETGVDYWILRNSYTSSWGDNGYMRIKKGVNLCGVEDFVFVPIPA